MERKIIAGASVALRCGTKLLLVRRGREPSKGLYAFPGGRVEKGETLEEAARRELFEETGIATGALRLLTALDLEAPEASFQLHVFARDGEEAKAVAADDADEAGWFTLEQMESLPLTDSTRTIARELLGREPPPK